MPSGFLGGGIGPVALKRRRAAAADWWEVAGQTCVAAYQPIGAASLAASYVNLANPGTYDAAPGVAPTLAAGGWSFGGAQYLTTGVVPGLVWTMVVRYSGVVPQDSFLAGAQSSSSTGWFSFMPRLPDGSTVFHRGSQYIQLAATGAASGVLALASVNAYRDGISAGEIPNAGTAPTGDIFIGGVRYTNTPVQLINGTIAAVAIYSTTLSAADVAALTTRMQALA